MERPLVVGVDGSDDSETVLRWAGETFGPDFAVTSSMADGLLAHLAGRALPGVDVIFLDTGLHFVETIGTRDWIASALPVSVQFETVQGSATAGADYVTSSGSLAFAPGEVAKSVAVAVVGDLLDEDDESFTVVLSAPVAAAMADGEALGTIVDDDVAQVSIADLSVTEGNGGTAATLTVTLSRASAFELSVPWTTGDVEARAGEAQALADLLRAEAQLERHTGRKRAANP